MGGDDGGLSSVVAACASDASEWSSSALMVAVTDAGGDVLSLHMSASAGVAPSLLSSRSGQDSCIDPGVSCKFESFVCDAGFASNPLAGN